MKKLAPVRREAVMLTQLMKDKQILGETVNQYAQDFQAILERTCWWQSSVDADSRASQPGFLLESVLDPFLSTLTFSLWRVINLSREASSSFR